jgi:hypothetical protein
MLRSKYAQLHEFGSEILPRVVLEHNVQVTLVSPIPFIHTNVLLMCSHLHES